MMHCPIACLDTQKCYYGLDGEAMQFSASIDPRSQFPDQGVLWFDGTAYVRLDRGSLEAIMGCAWASHLIFEKQSELLEGRKEWVYGAGQSITRVPSSVDAGCDQLLQEGNCLWDSLCVRNVGSVHGVDAGLGLFAAAAIDCNTWLCEYTGVVRRLGDLMGGWMDGDEYSYRLPVLDPVVVVSAEKYGNLARLINHSAKPNAELVTVRHEGLLHVVCRATRDLIVGEQILIDYGTEYWMARRDVACVELGS